MTRAHVVAISGLLAAVVAAIFLLTGNRIINIAIAVGVIASGWLLLRTWKVGQRLAAIAAAVSVSAAAGVLVLHNSREGVCTATNASGERVIIGTTLTPAGEANRRAHPEADNNALLESLGGLEVERAWTPESIRGCRVALGWTGALALALFGIAVVSAAASTEPAAHVAPPSAAATPLQVFVSYTHDDSATAARLQHFLEGRGIDVVIDTDDISPGERIVDFIDRSVRNCRVVVVLISSRSLVSTWVASETVAAIERSRWGRSLLLVACYLDDEWLQKDFRLRCTLQIDERLKQIDGLLTEYTEKKLAPTDLREEQARLYNLRNNLGVILDRFRDSMSLDMRGDQFEPSAVRLVDAIRHVEADVHKGDAQA